jgi:hypothetical protein
LHLVFDFVLRDRGQVQCVELGQPLGETTRRCRTFLARSQKIYEIHHLGHAVGRQLLEAFDQLDFDGSHGVPLVQLTVLAQRAHCAGTVSIIGITNFCFVLGHSLTHFMVRDQSTTPLQCRHLT